MTYVHPQDVTAPQNRWELRHVVFDDGPGGVAIAFGQWDDNAALVIRWNGTHESGRALGNPQSSGHATWFVLPQLLACNVAQALAGLCIMGHRSIHYAGLRATLEWLRRESPAPTDVYDTP